MLHASKVKALKRAIMGLLGTSKSNITRLTHKDLYFKSYYLPENLCKGIDFITQIERTSKKRVVTKLVETGISAYLGEKIADQIKLDHEARERDEKAKRTRFVFLLRKLAREQGYDISKFM